MEREIAVTLRDLLGARGISQAAAGVLAGVDQSTISQIVNGRVRARPSTIVKLATALGVSPRRMQRLCEAHYAEAHADEVLA